MVCNASDENALNVDIYSTRGTAAYRRCTVTYIFVENSDKSINTKLHLYSYSKHASCYFIIQTTIHLVRTNQLSSAKENNYPALCINVYCILRWCAHASAEWEKRKWDLTFLFLLTNVRLLISSIKNFWGKGIPLLTDVAMCK